MDRQYIENEHIVERYLSGDLTVREAREFQRFCAAHPELLDDWSIPPALRAQLTLQPRAQTDADAELSTTDAPTDAQDDLAIYAQRPLPGRIPGKAPPWWYSRNVLVGIALALLLTLGGLINFAIEARNLNGRLTTVTRAMEAARLQAHSSVQTYRVKLVRGRPQQPTLAVGWPTPPELLDLYVDVTEGNYNSFQVTIDRIDGSRVLQIRRIARDSNRELRLSLNSSAFGPGAYLMKFDGYTWKGQPQELGWIMLGLE